MEQRDRRDGRGSQRNLDRWQRAFSELFDLIAPRFKRYEPLRHAAGLIEGMVSGLDRKNCWTIAEHRRHASPDGLQHLLAWAGVGRRRRP